MALMTLGSLQLDGFEVPASIRLGGGQRAVVHKLLGGGRIIDTMGRDDCALRWSGVLSGPDAGDRARTLDAIRVSGATLPLAWDAFCYDVVVGDLHLDFCSPWWIKYRIECLVVSDLAHAEALLPLDLSTSVLGDLAAVSSYVDVASILTTLSAPSALSIGAPEVPSTLIALGGVQAGLTFRIGSAEEGLESQDLTTLVGSAGTLAQLTSAQGYIGRTISNLEGIVI